jgi:hypothetical protein
MPRASLPTHQVHSREIGSRRQIPFRSIHRRLPSTCPPTLPGWGRVTPFALRRSSQFEPDGPPRLSRRRYARDYEEVKAIGDKNSLSRTPERNPGRLVGFGGQALPSVLVDDCEDAKRSTERPGVAEEIHGPSLIPFS